MKNKLEILNNIGIGGTFISINDIVYKSDTADAVVYNEDEFQDKVTELIKEEIPYTDNGLLKKFLPEKFQSDIILDEYKELAKYDHTLISKSIIDEDLFLLEMLELENNKDLAELVLTDSKMWIVDEIVVFIVENELVD